MQTGNDYYKIKVSEMYSKKHLETRRIGHVNHYL